MQPDTHELIERYLLGRLGEDDLQAFEQRLAGEPSLREEVALQRQIFDALRTEALVADFRRQLDAVEKKMTTETTGKVVPMRPGGIRRWLAVAAGVLALAVAGWWVFIKNNPVKMTSQELFATYFQPPATIAVSSVQRSADTTAAQPLPTEAMQWNSLWKQLETQYQQGDFEASIATLEQIKTLDPAGEYASETFFYAALLHLRTGNPASALADLEKVTVGHTEDKTWYSALALLALGRNDEAKEAFHLIARSGHPRSREAERILALL
jgi:tetratricopeptide (TPR) repeat protein